jgi:hypothetical protein
MLERFGLAGSGCGGTVDADAFSHTPESPETYAETYAGK